MSKEYYKEVCAEREQDLLNEIEEDMFCSQIEQEYKYLKGKIDYWKEKKRGIWIYSFLS